MNIAVTGASGFFAKYVLHELIHFGYDVIAIDKKPMHPTDARFEFRLADLTKMEEATRALAGVDGVIHLAGIPHPLSDPPQEVYAANALGTFTTAWAAGEIGIKTFVFASSESVLGTAFHPEVFQPQYLPIDERHPTVPLDPYGISKVAAESAVESCAERFGFVAAALRMPWIWGIDSPERRTLYQQLITEFPNWRKNLWAFVDARDAARAFVQVLRVQLEPRMLHKYYIVADHTWIAPLKTTRNLIEEYFPNTHVPHEPDEYFSLISNAKAKAELGWAPEFEAEKLLN